MRADAPRPSDDAHADHRRALSGIGDSAFHDIVWYGRTFAPPPRPGDARVLLHFGAVDYRAAVWVNGQLVAGHEGGHTPFGADVTDYLTTSANTLIVRVHDPGEDPSIPRGKQDWKETSSHIFYSRTTGIWQTVWVEVVDSLYVRDLRLTPDVDAVVLPGQAAAVRAVSSERTAATSPSTIAFRMRKSRSMSKPPANSWKRRKTSSPAQLGQAQEAHLDVVRHPRCCIV